ncbi:MAG: hypothetical protein ACI8XV_003062, partial [Arenicella sp.]
KFVCSDKQVDPIQQQNSHLRENNEIFWDVNF